MTDGVNIVETFGAIFVPLTADQATRLQAWLKASKYRSRDAKDIVVLPGNAFAVVEQYGRNSHIPNWLPRREKVDGPLSFLQHGLVPELSLELGEAFAFIMLDDYLDYQHWKQGNLVRVLDGSADGWEIADGTPDPWEEKFFFSTERLEQRLNDLRDYDGLTFEQEADVRKVWAEKVIRVGAIDPLPVGATGAIRSHYFPKNPFI